MSGYLDVRSTLPALADSGREHDKAQVLLPASRTRRQAPTSIQAIIAAGGHRLLGRKMLTKRIGLPQTGHGISAAGNDPTGDGGLGCPGAVAPGSNARTLLSSSRQLGP